MSTATIEKRVMETLTEAKRKEWYGWGKDAYKSASRMMRNNARHPDYDTVAKVEACHDVYDRSYLLSDTRIERLKAQWGYSDEAVEDALQAFKDGYNSSRQWYKKADEKFQSVLDQYKSLFDESSAFANSVDVSDIKDGFPCGWAHLYLDDYPEGEELKKPSRILVMVSRKRIFTNCR
jgi:hypothetical protein